MFQNAVTSTVNISEWFEANSITMTLEWSNINGVTYVINVDPQVAVNYTERNSAILTVSYNINYNVSIVASLCGTNATTYSVLNYGKLYISAILY